MIRSLLGHNWKRIRRSPDLQRNVGSNVVLGFILATFFLNVLGLGLFLDRILRSAAPGRDPVSVLNGVLLYYLLADLVLRFFLQKVHTLSARPYLVLPVRKAALVHTLLVKSVLSWFNFAPLLLVVPAVFTVVSKSATVPGTVAWLLSLTALMLTNSYLNNYLRHRLMTNPIMAGGIVLLVISLLALEKYQVIAFSGASSALFQFVLDLPLLVVVPILLLVSVYMLNFTFLSRHLYLDEVSRLQRTRSVRDVFAFTHRFGVLGRLIGLEARMLIRNKRPKAILFFTVAMLFYGLFVYPNPFFVTMDFLLILVGMIVLGMFVYSYAVFAFSWESSYFGAIVTKHIDMREYLRAKYLLMVTVTSVAYLASLFYGLYTVRIILINTMLFLFTIGVGAFLMLYLASFNKTRFELGTSVFSQQGKVGFHYTAFIIAMAIHMVIFYSVKIAFNGDVAYVAFGALGLTGLLLHRRIIGLLVRQFDKRKHAMLAGFRAL